MAWSLSTKTAGAQQIDQVETVQRHNWGTIVEASDPVYGAGEFVYVKGVSGGFAGAVVTYNTSNGLTILATTSGTAYGGAPVGVMVAALDAVTKYGWLQVGGDASVKKTAVKIDPAGNKSVFLASATAGRIMQTSVASRRILGARLTSLTTVTSTTSTAVVNLQRPHLQSAP